MNPLKTCVSCDAWKTNDGESSRGLCRAALPKAEAFLIDGPDHSSAPVLQVFTFWPETDASDGCQLWRSKRETGVVK